MRADRIRLPGDAIACSHRGRNLRPDRTRRETWLKLRPGWYLRESAIPGGLPSWEVARLVTVARARATWLASSRSIRLTNQCAMVALGLDTWLSAPDIEFTQASKPGRTPLLPAISVGGALVPAVRQRQVPGIAGTPRPSALPTLVELAVDLARTSHPLVSVSGVSSVIDRLIVEGGGPGERQEQEALTKKQILSHLTNVPSSRYRRRADAVISAARSGTDSVGEGFLLWLLACVLPEEEAQRVTSQYHLHSGQRDFFADAALPHRKIAFEFDGGGKLVEDRSAARDFLARHRALEQRGWRIIRLSSSLMSDAPRALAQLVEDCRLVGVPIRAKPGPLWLPVPLELRDPARRWGSGAPRTSSP